MSGEDKDAMDYFRGVVAFKEHSDRVLQLTEHIVRMNPAHYSVWYVLSFDAPMLHPIKPPSGNIATAHWWRYAHPPISNKNSH
jgi:hypothetical protein